MSDGFGVGIVMPSISSDSILRPKTKAWFNSPVPLLYGWNHKTSGLVRVLVVKVSYLTGSLDGEYFFFSTRYNCETMVVASCVYLIVSVKVGLFAQNLSLVVICLSVTDLKVLGKSEVSNECHVGRTVGSME